MYEDFELEIAKKINVIAEDNFVRKMFKKIKESVYNRQFNIFLKTLIDYVKAVYKLEFYKDELEYKFHILYNLYKVYKGENK